MSSSHSAAWVTPASFSVWWGGATAHVHLTAAGDGTEMRISQTGGNVTPEQYQACTLGWQAGFDVLDQRVSNATHST